MKFLVILSVALTGLLSAQEPAGSKPTEKGTPLRLLALGEPPPFRQEVRGDRRVEIEAEPGALPPRQVAIGSNAEVNLTLNQAGAPLLTPPLDHVELHDKQKVWTTLAIPENLRTKPKLALFWRDPGKTWDSPHSLLLPDGADVFPAGQVRFVNLLPTASALKIGEQTRELAAGEIWLCPAPTTGQTLQISFRTADGGWMPVHAATLEPAAAGTRVEVIVYRADTASARRPAKALVLREQVATEAIAPMVAAAGR